MMWTWHVLNFIWIQKDNGLFWEDFLNFLEEFFYARIRGLFNQEKKENDLMLNSFMERNKSRGIP